MGHPLFAFAGFLLPAVFKFYDGLSRFSCPSSYVMSRRRARERFPHLANDTMKYTQVFYEGMHVSCAISFLFPPKPPFRSFSLQRTRTKLTHIHPTNHSTIQQLFQRTNHRTTRAQP